MLPGPWCCGGGFDSRARFDTETLRKCVLLDQYDNDDGTFDVYVAGVARDSQPAQVAPNAFYVSCLFDILLEKINT